MRRPENLFQLEQAQPSCCRVHRSPRFLLEHLHLQVHHLQCCLSSWRLAPPSPSWLVAWDVVLSVVVAIGSLRWHICTLRVCKCECCGDPLAYSDSRRMSSSEVPHLGTCIRLELSNVLDHCGLFSICILHNFAIVRCLPRLRRQVDHLVQFRFQDSSAVWRYLV